MWAEMKGAASEQKLWELLGSTLFSLRGLRKPQIDAALSVLWWDTYGVRDTDYWWERTQNISEKYTSVVDHWELLLQHNLDYAD